MKETLTKELLKKLEDKYMMKSIENWLYLKKQLFWFQYKEGNSMSEHLNDFNKILADLQNLDVEIVDEDKVLLLLNSLTDTYEQLTTTLLYGKDSINFDDVSNALVNNEYRRKDKHAHGQTIGALTVRGKSEQKKLPIRNYCISRKRGISSERKILSKDKCTFCRQKGH